MNKNIKKIINESEIWDLIEETKNPSNEKIESILKKSEHLERLSLKDTAYLLNAVSNPESYKKVLDMALKVKNSIYGNRIVFFAPLYVSNYCKNDCLYCAFRSANKELPRKALSQPELENETISLLKEGHKRVLMVAGETYPPGEGLDYIFNSIDTVYNTRYQQHNIRRINVNIAPLEIDEFVKLKSKNIGTYQLFQETYHRETYKKMHVKGPKSDYDYRLEAMDRAFKAGIDDLGVGVLFGLADWRFETLALLQHVEHLEKQFNIGPHTISIPRLEPASGSDVASNPPDLVTDHDFKHLVAVLRLAVPYTGLILSTRESPQIRKELLQMGVSQISAGSRTNPGGYSEENKDSGDQFSLGDHRSLDEVVLSLLKMNFLPSFCTACYRLGRTGLDFMEYAKPGDIRKKCDPNGLITLKEYLCDFASPQTKQVGEQKLAEWLANYNDPKLAEYINKAFKEIESGKRDIFI